jgi:hypothetical protein
MAARRLGTITLDSANMNKFIQKFGMQLFYQEENNNK